MLITIFLLALVGFCISLYAYFVEQKIKKTPDYRPACDLSDIVSCSKPVRSPYAKIFIYSNAIISMVFYAFIAFLALLNASAAIFYAVIIACAASVVLAYLLYFKIKALCLICTSLYIINLLLLIVSCTL